MRLSLQVALCLGLVGCASTLPRDRTPSQPVGAGAAWRNVPTRPPPVPEGWEAMSTVDDGRIAWLARGRDPERAQPGGTITVDWTGWTADGRRWASTFERPFPHRSVIGGPRMFPSLDEALRRTAIGDHWVLEVSAPADLPGRFPAGARLVLEMFVRDIDAPPPARPPAPAPGRGVAAAPGDLVVFDQSTYVAGALVDTTLTRGEPVSVVLGTDSPLDRRLAGARPGEIRVFDENPLLVLYLREVVSRHAGEQRVPEGGERDR